VYSLRTPVYSYKHPWLHKLLRGDNSTRRGGARRVSSLLAVRTASTRWTLDVGDPMRNMMTAGFDFLPTEKSKKKTRDESNKN